MAIVCWSLVFLDSPSAVEKHEELLLTDLADASQIVFFLLAALAVVEVINVHNGFALISKLVRTSSKKKLLFIFTLFTFFLSAILDNLTSTIVMISILQKIALDKNDRWIIGGAIVIAANAGGAWSPIGDVTTTMLWIGGQLSSFGMIRQLFLPSLAACAAACAILSCSLKGAIPAVAKEKNEEPDEPLSLLFLFLGIGALLFVPVFKMATGLPPFMGILLSLSILWIVTDLLHGTKKDSEHLRFPRIFAQIDLSSILFFLGILLAVAALRSGGLLTALASWFDVVLGDVTLIAIFIGLSSAVIDNVPLVAAAMGMYDLTVYPIDSYFWQLIAYCAGTGGSILVIGSAAGIVFMGMEEIDFFGYLRRISLAALVGYFVGVAVYMILT